MLKKSFTRLSPGHTAYLGSSGIRALRRSTARVIAPRGPRRVWPRVESDHTGHIFLKRSLSFLGKVGHCDQMLLLQSSQCV